MQKLLLVIMVVMFPILKIQAQSDYRTNNALVLFFAEAPIANVDAVNKKVKAELNTTTHEVKFTIAMANFQFKNKKMGRDAEKKYLETAKYPNASFIGKISGSVNYGKPGSYPVVAKGKLKIHGVEKQVSEKGTITVGKAEIKLRSEFHVSLKDYNIETPTILGKEMTADNVLVKIEATLSEQVKPLSKK